MKAPEHFDKTGATVVSYMDGLNDVKTLFDFERVCVTKSGNNDHKSAMLSDDLNKEAPDQFTTICNKPKLKPLLAAAHDFQSITVHQ